VLDDLLEINEKNQTDYIIKEFKDFIKCETVPDSDDYDRPDSDGGM
jgi:hypothetical protein